MDEWLRKKSLANISYADLKKWHGLEGELEEIVGEMAAARKKTAKEHARQEEEALVQSIEELAKSAKEIKGVKVVSHFAKGADVAALRSAAVNLAAKTPGTVVLLASDAGQKASLVLALEKNLTKKGLNAQELIKPVAELVGGSGGGRPELAQAGGRDASRIAEAIELIYKLIEERTRK
jgi:alanyl-tRNA synthetase